MDGKYLLKRGRTWYVRFAIPHTVQDIFGKQEDEGYLCDHPFKALETLLSVPLELILYQKTCTRIWFK